LQSKKLTEKFSGAKITGRGRNSYRYEVLRSPDRGKGLIWLGTRRGFKEPLHRLVSIRPHWQGTTVLVFLYGLTTGFSTLTQLNP
jgi:hypothetical protein